MKAAAYEGKERLVVREVPEPALEVGEVLLAIDACCVCGTDLRTYRHGDAKITPPRILSLDRVTEAFPLMESGEALKVCIDPRAHAS